MIKTIENKILDLQNNIASKDESRYNLIGIYFHKIDDKIRAVATDGHILAFYDDLDADMYGEFVDKVYKFIKIKKINKLESETKVEEVKDAQFPDYLQVFKYFEYNSNLGINVNLFSRLAKATGNQEIQIDMALDIEQKNGLTMKPFQHKNKHLNFTAYIMPMKTERIY